MLVDSHCHLDFPELAKNIDQLVDSMKCANVRAALCVGVSLPGAQGVLSLLRQYPNLYGAVGVHPEEKEADEPDEEVLEKLASHERIVGIGETGLDYYWHKDKPEWQRERFRVHVRAARRCRKPLIVHMRDSADDTLRILREEGAEQPGGVMHCFTETLDVARQALDLGFYISFSGIVTFKNSLKIKEVAKKIPIERILVETDAPYLAPVPFRGKTNQPAYVRYVAEEIARLRGIGIDEVEQATTENFCRLFKVVIN